MRSTTLHRAGAASLAVLALALATPRASAAPSTAPAASADAYALDVDVTLPLGIDVDNGPHARSSQEAPPESPDPVEDEVIGVPQIPPGSGTAVESIGILSSGARAVLEPGAVAFASAAEVELLNLGSGPMITAEALVAVSTTTCTELPSAEGTTFAGLEIAGQEFDAPIQPNTPVLPQVFDPLGLRVVLNEQHQAADGRGLVVNAIHIYNVPGSPVPPLFTGDIIVSHAMSTVNCPNGAPTTGGQNDIFITKDANKAKAKPGELVTYTAVFQNNTATDTACLVNQAIDHLPVAFEFVSTSGAFGTDATTVERPGGGTDVVIKPTGVSIPKGGSVTQTYVVRVKADAAPATYFNNVELLCAGLGNWVKGLDAPVEVVTEIDEPTPKPDPKAQCEDGKDNDGDGKVDYPADPGCTSRKDDDERNELARTGPVEHASTLGALLLLAAYGVRRRMPEC